MEPYLGEIRCFAFGRIPTGWLSCQGQLLPINQNQALFSLLGTQFGGNGTTNFALPNLQGRAPVHYSTSQPVGTQGGEENVTLTQSQMPSHNHLVNVSTTAADQRSPLNNFLAMLSAPHMAYGPATNLTGMAGDIVGMQGGSQPHNNMQPYTVLSYCIATQGVYPNRP